MTARDFLVRGLLAGLLAGFATFGVAYFVGEPQVQAAITIEEAGTPAHAHDDSAVAGHTHDESGTVVSRHNQRTWGLLTGTLGVSIALGGLVGLLSAFALGRIGRFSPGQSTAVVALVGFVAVALVPFTKYPATPPSVGNADTIGARTTEYFVYLLISILAAAASLYLGNRLWRDRGAYTGVLGGLALFLVVVVVAGALMPTVNEIGSFPADTLWYFRRASLMTQATMWATIGILMTGLVGKLHRDTSRVTARRELAASL